MKKLGVLLLLLAVPAMLPALAQAPDPSALIAAQREAMAPLARMDGVWRGPAWTLQPNGEKRHITQTERVGPFLDGSVKVIEGRGYREDGAVGFNAFGIISYDPAKRVYTMHSYVGNTDWPAGSPIDRKSTRLNSSHIQKSRMPSSA